MSFTFLTGFYGCATSKLAPPNAGAPGGISEKLTDYVDTRAGTGGLIWTSGNTTPAAMAPHGMVKLGPDTHTLDRVWSSSGYFYGDGALLGFSHTRLSGTGAWDGGILRAMPSTAAKNFSELAGFSLAFSHAEEVAVPGYYAVNTLSDPIRVELTAAPHVGVHRYTFPNADSRHVTLDLTSHLSAGGNVVLHYARVDLATQQVVGTLHLSDDFTSRNGGLTVHFILRSRTQFQSFRWVTAAGESAQSELVNPVSGKWFLDLNFSGTGGTSVAFDVALSHTSLPAAVDNLHSETKGQTLAFDAIRRETESKWEVALGAVQVSGGTQTERQILYQSLYRSHVMPTIFSDAPPPGSHTRTYRGFDKAVHTTENFDYYSDLSLWDSFRTVHPLYNLIAPTVEADVIRSLLAMGEQGGTLPRWAAANGDTSSMLGFPAHILIADSYLKGIRDFDAEKALTQILAAGDPASGVPRGQECLASYLQYGYCPQDQIAPSVSFTLEYSYADDATARFAEAMGRTDVASAYGTRRKTYRNVWSAEERAFVPRRSNGAFESDFSLYDNSYLAFTASGAHFAEGSPYQWRFYVPYDAENFISQYGPADFISDLDRFLEHSGTAMSSAYPGPYYWHGNEPDLQAPFLFAFAGRPDLTQKWVRWILENRYRASADALDGQDDGGTLSAWYVFASLGFFPIAGTTRYVLASPVFDTARIAVGNRTLTLQAVRNAPSDIYVCRVTFDGVPLEKPWFEHELIQRGGEFRFFMSATPCPWNTP